MATNLYFSDTDLYYIFSGNVGGGTLGATEGYTDDDSADNLANLGNYYDDGGKYLKPVNNVGYTTIDGQDFSSILNPWYKDQIVSPSDSNSSIQYDAISIPTWASRVAILIQAGGGAGVSSWTQDYYTYSQLTYTSYAQTSYTYNNFYNYMKHNNCWTPANYTKCYQQLTNYGVSAGYSTYGTSTNENYTTMSGETGGGGGCIAAVFDVNNGDIAENSTLIISTDHTSATISDEPSYYSSISVTIGSSYSIWANGGSSAVTPSSSYMSSYQNLPLETSTAGNGGITSGNNSNLPSGATILYSNGSNGSTGGEAGYYNDNTINSNFLPSINTSDYGTGSANTTGTDGIVRYWFIV